MKIDLPSFQYDNKIYQCVNIWHNVAVPENQYIHFFWPWHYIIMKKEMLNFPEIPECFFLIFFLRVHIVLWIFFFHIIKPRDACLYAKCYSHSQKIHDVCDIYFTAFFVHNNFKISYFNLNFNSVVSGLVLIYILMMKIWLW